MTLKTIIFLIALHLSLLIQAQQTGTPEIWSLNDCISYALDQNVDVRKSILTNTTNQLNANQAANNRLPSVSGSVRQNFSWAKSTESNTQNSTYNADNSTSYSLNSSIVLYNGSKLKNMIQQAELDMQSGIYDSEAIKESISLSILNNYLQVLFTEEQVTNAEKQIEATTEQLNLAQERLAVSIISRSDFLQVKSQLASEKLSLASARSQYAMAKVSLMQLMELPVKENFAIIHPKIDESINANLVPKSADIYAQALDIKPEVKSASYQKNSAALNEKIAKAGYIPTLSADAGIGTGYSKKLSTDYANQVRDQISPSVGLSLAIPIFQKRQVKTNVSLAKISYQTSELKEIETKNKLRKEIEQACLDVVSVQSEFEASKEQFEASTESYVLAEEKYKNGLINSVDFLFEKTNQIVAESTYLQTKYNLIFNYKILDFYMGNPINL